MAGATYRMHLAESLGDSLADWFAPLVHEDSAGGGTLLTGAVADQAALHGILARIRDLNLTIVAVVRLDSLPPEAAAHYGQSSTVARLRC